MVQRPDVLVKGFESLLDFPCFHVTWSESMWQCFAPCRPLDTLPSSLLGLVSTSTWRIPSAYVCIQCTKGGWTTAHGRRHGRRSAALFSAAL